MYSFLRRLRFLLLFIWAEGTLVFFLAHMLPGDPTISLLGPHPSYEDIQTLRHSLDLSLPLFSQYVNFISRLFVLDFGYSLSDRLPVLGKLLAVMPKTLLLTSAAMIVTIILTWLTGYCPLVGKHPIWYIIAELFCALCLSVPIFLLGILMVLLFSVSIRMLPVSGSGSLRHLIMPAITLGIPFGALLSRILRTSLQVEQRRPYFLLARAKGLPTAQILRRHVLPNALSPVINLAAMQIGALLSGAIIIESLFSWPGIGSLLVVAIRQRDYPMIQGIVILSSLFYHFLNDLADKIGRNLDPRCCHDPS